MKEVNQKIIAMILENATANQICEETGLSGKQLFYRLNLLKQKGYDFNKKYYYNGEICYTLKNDIKNDSINLITDPNQIEIKLALISDLHLTNKLDRVDLLNIVYEFCSKNDIHIIINAGDILDGFLGKIDDKKVLNSDEQIEYLLKYYPYDKNIINFVCFGNHDYSILTSTGQNLETIFSIKRHDIVSLGYGIGKLNIKKDTLFISHPKACGEHIKLINKGIMFIGHSHRAMNVINGHTIKIFIPSLSDITISDFSSPGFIECSLKFNSGVISFGLFKQYKFLDKKMYKMNEFYTDIHSEKRINKGELINNEEIFNFLKKDVHKSYKISQIEKFNKKYNG